MIFENAVAAEAAEIAALVNKAYRAEGGAEGWTSERGLLRGDRISEDGVRARLRSARILLARRAPGGAINGCIDIAVDPDGAWHTSMLAVDPALQTAGIGKAIKHEVERQAQAAGVSRMRMEVIRQREALVAWHRRRGFAPTGATLPFPYDNPAVGRPVRDDLDLLVMEKQLATATVA